MPMDNEIELHGSVWLTVGGENFGGPSRVALLAKIAECGSITQAAKAVKMSYKAAWDAIDMMNNLAGEPLVERLAGGKGGGGTRLTPRGEQLVCNFQMVEQEHRRFVEQLGRQSAGLADDYVLIRRVSMKTSARNQFFGKVSSVKTGAVNDEIELDVTGGHKIVAIITHASTEELGLRVGAEAFALVKASSIILMSANENAKFSARNQLTGTISRLQPGAVNTEVVIDLPGGGSVAAIVTNDSSNAMGLAPGGTVTALFKASSVILAVPD
ncbi:LysR family transcriptional regulator [Massilia cavernae]|uniref:LysR family transcriptional regulator n=2 Tax=Massilia cavernae TaxID=2320864 RepID=A0A418Y4Y5_9BURK|nr:TOBE domain-containing protein [Massilia cavernae]RJG20996.1 LysR family transcriptional regulator [Massilia cavernae]